MAGGTGDLVKAFAKQIGPQGKAILLDINAAMLNIGRDRLLDSGFSEISSIPTNAEYLPFAEANF